MFLLRLIWAVVRALFAERADLVAENLALRQQLIVFRRNAKRPRLRKRDRICEPPSNQHNPTNRTAQHLEIVPRRPGSLLDRIPVIGRGNFAASIAYLPREADNSHSA
jgi:hypothetical protein